MLNASKAFAYVKFSGANGFDLCTSQLDTAFVSGEDVIAMADKTIVECWGIIGARALSGRGSKASRRWKGRKRERKGRLEEEGVHREMRWRWGREKKKEMTEGQCRSRRCLRGTDDVEIKKKKFMERITEGER